jgi:tRNA dimethylallyltransferase
MIENGLLDEVKSFYDKGITFSGIGYKELFDYYMGKISLDDATDLIKRNSRRYAKRQYTFFNNQFNIKWFDVNFNDFDETIGNVCQYIELCKKDSL